jgi:MFS family permease
MKSNPSSGGPVRPRAGGIARGLRGLAIDTTVLRQSRDFRLLFAGQAINLIGGQIRMVAVPYLVFLITRSSLMVGVLSLVQFVPAVFFGVAGGTVADMVDRRRLLLITQALLAATSLCLAAAALARSPSLWLIFILVGIAAGIQAVDQPTRRAAIPRLVGRAQIVNAMAFNQITNQLGNVVGPAVAGLILARIGIGPALFINTVTFCLSFVTLLGIAPLPPATGAMAPKGGIAATFEGLSFLKGQPVILSTFLVDLNATFFGGPKALFPALATEVFKTGPVGLGLLYSAPGAGAFLGALMTGWVNRVRHQGRAVLISVCIWASAITAFGLMTHLFWLALVFLAIAGAADMFSAIFRSTILQLAVPDRLRGRLSGIHFMVVSSGPRLGDFEAGSVAALAGSEFSIVSGGLAALIGTIAIAFAIPAFARYDAHEMVEEPD